MINHPSIHPSILVARTGAAKLGERCSSSSLQVRSGAHSDGRTDEGVMGDSGGWLVCLVFSGSGQAGRVVLAPAGYMRACFTRDDC